MLEEMRQQARRNRESIDQMSDIGDLRRKRKRKKSDVNDKHSGSTLSLIIRRV